MVKIKQVGWLIYHFDVWIGGQVGQEVIWVYASCSCREYVCIYMTGPYAYHTKFSGVWQDSDHRTGWQDKRLI